MNLEIYKFRLFSFSIVLYYIIYFLLLQPDRVQVEGRLNQIREYIKVTSTMMDSLNQSGDPVSIFFLLFHIECILILVYKQPRGLN